MTIPGIEPSIDKCWQWYWDLRKRVSGNDSVEVFDLDFSVRTNNCLKNAGISTVQELLTKKPGDLLELLNFGGKCLVEVEVLLADLGVRLTDSSAEYPTDPLPNRFKYALDDAYDRMDALKGNDSGRAERISLRSYIMTLERNLKRVSERQRQMALLEVAKEMAAGNPHLEKIACTGGFTHKELVVLRERAGKTLKQISDILGLKSVESVRQAEAKAFRKLRHPSRKHLANEIHSLGLCARVGIKCDQCVCVFN
jgi:DNA-binding CsgD family transcriptional regulator